MYSKDEKLKAFGAFDSGDKTGWVADNVNSPAHYQSEKGIECIDAIEAALTPEEFRGYLKGNCIKYIWRERLKGGIESCKKAQYYLNRLAK